MTGFIRQRPIISSIAAFLVLLLVLGSFPIVPETKQALIVRFFMEPDCSAPARVLTNRP